MVLSADFSTFAISHYFAIGLAAGTLDTEFSFLAFSIDNATIAFVMATDLPVGALLSFTTTSRLASIIEAKKFCLTIFVFRTFRAMVLKADESP